MTSNPRGQRDPNESLKNLTRLAYSVREAAHMLGASESTVRQWVHEGKLRALRKGKGRDRQHFSIPLRSIQELLDRASG